MSHAELAADRARRFREKCTRFRVLVIGRANAGKTTILQKVCNTTEEPEIYDHKTMKKIDASVVVPTEMRGLHDIENEMVFRSNPGFIFHDSRGFEAGATSELDNVREFTTRRSKERNLQNQVHVIWYCIPMDDSRAFTRAEINFFSEYGTGSVPVIVIFTKFDALYDKAFDDLEKEGVAWVDAKKQAPRRAVIDFEAVYLDQLYKRKYPPKDHVYLQDMNRPEANCHELTEKTAAVLDDDNLQLLFVSTQQNNSELCIKYAIRRTLWDEMTSGSTTITESFKRKMLGWFPQFLWWGRPDDTEDTNELKNDIKEGHNILLSTSGINDPAVQSSLDKFAESQPLVQQKACLGIALTIIGDYSFFLWDQDRLMKEACIGAAILHYQKSPSCNAVAQAVDQVFREHKVDEGYNIFTEQLIQIALNNRLSAKVSSSAEIANSSQLSHASDSKVAHMAAENPSSSTTESTSQLVQIADNASLKESGGRKGKVGASISRQLKCFKIFQN